MATDAERIVELETTVTNMQAAIGRLTLATPAPTDNVDNTKTDKLKKSTRWS